MNESINSVEEMLTALFSAQQRMLRDECARVFEPLEALLRAYEDESVEAA